MWNLPREGVAEVPPHPHSQVPNSLKKLSLDMQMMEIHGDWGTLVCGFYHQMSLWLSKLICLRRARGQLALKRREGGIPWSLGPDGKWASKARLSQRRVQTPNCTLFRAPKEGLFSAGRWAVPTCPTPPTLKLGV